MVENSLNIKELADFIETNRSRIDEWTCRMNPGFTDLGFSEDEVAIVALTYSMQDKILEGAGDALQHLKSRVINTDLYVSAFEKMIGIKRQ